MEFEKHAYSEIKRYLERLGYPDSSIFPKYNIQNSKIDAVVKSKDEILIAIEIKSFSSSKSITTDEIGYHPITRNLQKVAFELGAKYFLLSDGIQHLWLKTGKNGRPEKTVAVQYAQFHANTLSEFEFTKAMLAHVNEYVKNFPLTGDHLYDVSLILYAKLTQGKDKMFSIKLQDIFGAQYNYGKLSSGYSQDKILEEALERLKDVELMDNRVAVYEFIDTLFEISRKEWNVPRWIADLMVALIKNDNQVKVLDLFSRNGILTSAAYLRGIENVHSYYTSQKELFWIIIQHILANQNQPEIKFEPGLLKGNFEDLHANSMDAVLLAPPFSVKLEGHINSYLGKHGIKDGNALFIEAALNVTNDKGQVVAIVPEGFLFSRQYQKARAYFESEVEAIISLPGGAFKPYSSIKTSLLILRKNHSAKQKKTFMAFFDNVPESNPLYKEYDNVVNGILEKFDLFRAGKEFVPSPTGFTVEKLSADNFHVSKYWQDKHSKSSDTVKSGFSVITLKEAVKTIFRGSPIVKDTDGNIPYINPAVVRELRLNKEHLSYTSDKKLLDVNIKLVSVNDVLVNIIGPYRGKTALVTKGFEGMPVNYHVAIIKANPDFILPGYLAIALNSQFVQEQFHDQRSGTVIPALNLSSFEHIVLPVPNFEIQKQIYEEYTQLLDEIATIHKRAAVLEGEISQRLSNLGKESDRL